MNKSTKILIISSYNFYEGNDATSITLRNIFSGFDKKDIALVHTTSNPYQTTEKNVFVLYNKKFDFFQTHKNTTFAKAITEERSVIQGVKNEYKQAITFKKKFLNRVHTYVSAYNSLIPYEYSEALDSFIQTQQPNVIYSPLGSIPIMQLVIKISKKYNIPIVPHFMDDWMHTLYEDDIWMTIPKIAKKRYLKKIFQRTKCGLAISEVMAKEYSHQFKLPFFALMNCLDVSNDIDLEDDTKKKVSTGVKSFVYCGGLHLNRWKSLLSLCDAISHNSYSGKIRFYIYTKPEDWEKYGNYFNSYEFVNYEGFLSNQEMYRKLYKYEVLVHVESFDEQVIKYTRLSISTKIPEYLSRKKLILAIGPKGIASIEYLRENNAAIIIDELTDHEFEDKLMKVIDNQNNDVINNSYQLFLKYHTKSNQFNILSKVLTIDAD